MKIFISYGHNDYTELVDRLYDALMEAGHQPWKDDRYEGVSGIAPGQDFTEVIYKAIDSADFVIAFVSRCTQDKPYCRDERQYAYNKKGTHFIQLRLDRVEITLGNARSYIDMSDVVDTTGRIYEKLFQSSLNAIFAAFRDPESFSEGGITPWTKIDTHLKVPGSLKYHDFIARLDSDFVGRDWLLEQCKAWAQDDTISRRLFVIFGEAGTGKTAFIRRLSQDEELVRSVHVCIYDRPSTRTVQDTLKNLAYVLACKCESYYDFLKTENLEKIKDMQADALFEYLFLEPLKTVQDKYLLIIDGLDELEEASGLKPLMRIFRQYADLINPNISFLVTTRPDETITDLLKTVGKGKPLESITLSKDVNKDDLQLYITQKLQEMDCYSEALAGKILDACDGNFEYLSLLFKEAQEEGLQVSGDMVMPRGLNERYIQYLDRRMDARDLTRLSKQHRQLLALLCASREPIPLSLMADAADMDEDDVLDELDAFGSLIHRSEESDPRISLFTKGFRDFLLSKSCRRYSADGKLGTELLAQYMMENIRRDKDLKKQPYLDRNGFVHLLQYGAEEPGDVAEYINALYEKDVDVIIRIVDALCMDPERTMDAYFEIPADSNFHYDIINQLNRKHALIPLRKAAQFALSNGNTRNALQMQARLLLWEPSPENTAKAEQLYRQIAALHSQEKETDPYYLAIAYDGLADLAIKKGTEQDLKQAEQWYRRAMELYEQMHQDDPSYENSRNLAISYDKICDILMEKGTAQDLEQAMQWSLKAESIHLRNYRQHPCYETCRDLSIAYDKIGNIFHMKDGENDLSHAEKWYMKALELTHHYHRENPCYESRRDLAVAFQRLIGIASEDSSGHHSEKVMQWLTHALELDQQNHRENPCYESRRDLSMSYIDLARHTMGSGTAEDQRRAMQIYLQALELRQRNCRENPCYESRKDLAALFEDLAELAAEMGSAEERNHAKQWYLSTVELYQRNYRENPCYESQNDLAYIFGALADFVSKMGSAEDLNQEKQWYLSALELRQQIYQDNPSLKNRIEVSGSNKDLAFLAIKTGTQEDLIQAKQWFTAALELDQQSYLEDPCYDSRRTLIMSYSQLATTLQKKGTPDDLKQAQQYLRKAVELSGENCEENPCYESRHDLSLFLIRLSDISAKSGTGEDLMQAQQQLLEALELRKQNYAEDPCLPTRRGLSVVYDKLCNVAIKKDTPDDLKQALHWISNVTELDQQNYAEDPNFNSRRDLAISFRRRGILTAENDALEDLPQVLHFFTASMELLRENYQQNPSSKSRHDLSVSYELLATLAEQTNTPEALAQAKKWDALRAELEGEEA